MVLSIRISPTLTCLMGKAHTFPLIKLGQEPFKEPGVDIGGKYGVGVVYQFFSHFAKQDMGSEMSLLGLRIEQFTKLIEKM